MKRKNIRERGKIRLSRYFQKLKEGDKVAVVRELSERGAWGFPKNIQGRTGIVESKRGKAYIVKINDKDKEKTYIIKPVHLKKIGGLKE